jgi:hypothetical protein
VNTLIKVAMSWSVLMVVVMDCSSLRWRSGFGQKKCRCYAPAGFLRGARRLSMMRAKVPMNSLTSRR